MEFTVIRDVAVNGFPRHSARATAHGVVTESKDAGTLGGSPELALRLTSLDLGGQNYPIDSDQFKVKGPNKAGHTVGNAVGGAILGAIIAARWDAARARRLAQAQAPRQERRPRQQRPDREPGFRPKRS